MRIGDWVRVRLGGGWPHHNAAKIMAIGNGTVTVKPIRHKGLEVVEMSECRLWKSRNASLPRKEQKMDAENQVRKTLARRGVDLLDFFRLECRCQRCHSVWLVSITPGSNGRWLKRYGNCPKRCNW